MTGSKCDDLVYIITRMGCIHIVDSHTGFTLYSQKLFHSNTLIFVSCLTGDSGILCVTRLAGEVYKIDVQHEKVFQHAMCNDNFLELVPQVSILISIIEGDFSLVNDIK